MTNADKYLKDGVDVEELTDKILEYNEKNRSCTFYENMRSFWKSKAKPTLTEDEEVILRNIEICTYIGRTNNGELYMWKCEDGILPIFIDDLYGSKFQFIQPRRRI